MAEVAVYYSTRGFVAPAYRWCGCQCLGLPDQQNSCFIRPRCSISDCLLFVDGIRHLLSGALRGMHDSRAPMRIGIMAMWLVSVPLSYLIGVICHGGPVGLRLGFFSGFIFATLLLFLRIDKNQGFKSKQNQVIVPQNEILTETPISK